VSTDARRHSLVFPREHGAWGILLVPLVTGAAAALLAGGALLPLLPLTIVALSLFWMRTPLESWIGSAAVRARTPEEVALVRKATLLLGAVSAAGLVWLFWGPRNLTLLWIGGAAAAAFAAQALVRKQWKEARTESQIIGAAGLTSLAAAAYCVSAGGLPRQAWALWGANFLFAFNQIQYVHLRIQAARATTRQERLINGAGFLAAQVILIFLLLLAGYVHLFSWWAVAAFTPLLVRGFAWYVAPPKTLAIHALGKQELFHAIAFGVLLVVGFQLAR
jgi:hypothetical protein